MPIPKVNQQTPTSIGRISGRFQVNTSDGDAPNIQVNELKIEILDQDGNQMKTIQAKLSDADWNEASQASDWVGFIQNLRVQAERAAL